MKEIIKGVLQSSVKENLFDLIEEQSSYFQTRVLQFVLNTSGLDTKTEFNKEFNGGEEKAIIEDIYDSKYLELGEMVEFTVNYFRDGTMKKSYEVEFEGIGFIEEKSLAQQLAADLVKNQGGKFNISPRDCQDSFKEIIKEKLQQIKRADVGGAIAESKRMEDEKNAENKIAQQYSIEARINKEQEQEQNDYMHSKILEDVYKFADENKLDSDSVKLLENYIESDNFNKNAINKEKALSTIKMIAKAAPNRRLAEKEADQIYKNLETTEFDEVMQGNDAILSIRNPEKFQEKINKVFGTELRALKGIFPESLIGYIVGFVGEEKTNHLNLQDSQDIRMKVVQKDTNKEITPATANYDIKEFLVGTNDVYGKAIELLPVGMLINEHIFNLMPSWLKQGMDEKTINTMQHGTECILGITGSIMMYKQGYLPLDYAKPMLRAGLFHYKKEIILPMLAKYQSELTETIKIHTSGYVGEKEIELGVDMAITMLFAGTTMKKGFALGLMVSVPKYFSIDQETTGVGTVFGMTSAGLLGYQAGITSLYEYVGQTITGGYLGKMAEPWLVSVYENMFKTSNIEETPSIDMHDKAIAANPLEINSYVEPQEL